MLRILFAIVAISFSLSASAVPNVPPINPNENMDAAFSIGFGYQLCRQREVLPPLETAFICPGVVPVLRNVNVTLTPQKTAKPEWKLWSGSVKNEIEALGVTFEYELLVSHAIVDGKTLSFVDGRITDNKLKQASYFRITAYGGFDQLDSTHNYSRPVEVKASRTDDMLDLSAVITVGKTQAVRKKP